MAHTMIVGAPGSGKTVLAQFLIDQAFQRAPDGSVLTTERLFSTIPLEGHDIPCTRVAWTREERDQIRSGVDDEGRRIGTPDPTCMWIYDVHCGVLFIDEIHHGLPARGYDRLPRAAMTFWTMHRHRDLEIFSTTQHVSFVDKICRIITDRVLLCAMGAVPLIALWHKDSVRPPDPCTLLGHQHPHHRRDAPGDQLSWLHRTLRYGSVIDWAEFSPSILNDTESLDLAYIAEQGIEPRGKGRLPFSMKWAARSRRSVETSFHTSGADAPSATAEGPPAQLTL